MLMPVAIKAPLRSPPEDRPITGVGVPPATEIVIPLPQHHIPAL